MKWRTVTGSTRFDSSWLEGLLIGVFATQALDWVSIVLYENEDRASGSVSSIVALMTGTLFGRAYDGTVIPLVAGFAVLLVAALFVTELAERGQPATASAAPS